ncbi:DNA-binding transcriptional regulator, MarR family [Devosia sp. YR412]|uniref:MarR family winged helix-turn-helix transcriptional regulator n=1 Tax=Devosia sp. YR412 TaxID=1881030 RepID=UPI0008AB44BC|nr:MarR family winged helix-turn-helix transcriptional regulator [Devosia sp. YR412]SEP71948.1 DNA-binding transcriptional regulator, MarR family [Devosia sp. YR412]
MPQTDINALLRKAGIAEATVTAVVEIDALLQNWRRRALKRELGHRALIDLKIGIDLAQLDVLFAIEAPVDEFGETAGGETMVASVAERLAIDPSRASRVVSEMVEAGYARRSVSQADARRTIIELTETGRTVVEAVRAYKFLIMGDFLSNWTAAELAAFTPMLRKFGQWPEHTGPGAEKFAEDIVVLAERIARVRDKQPA